MNIYSTELQCSQEVNKMCSDGSIDSFDFDSVNQASRLFKIMSNFNRIRIIALLNENDMTVTDVSKQLSLEQSAVSHQLRILKDANIVASTTRGKERIYRLADSHIYTIFEQALQHVREVKLHEKRA